MSVRARFFVQSITRVAAGSHEVKLSAVGRGEENKTWAHYTPVGHLSMVLSPAAGGAADWFNERLGKEVFLDISDADEPEPAPEAIPAP